MKKHRRPPTSSSKKKTGTTTVSGSTPLTSTTSIVTPPRSIFESLSEDTLQHVLSFLPGSDLANFRATSKTGRRQADLNAQTQTPYPDYARFAIANQERFPATFGKSGSTKRIGKREAMHGGWEVYDRAARGPGPAYYERLPDKDALFGKSRSSRRKGYTDRGQVFKPPVSRDNTSANFGRGIWSPQINDAWNLGHLHTGHEASLESRPTRANLWERGEGRPTATGREVLQARLAGYSSRALPEKNDVGARPIRFTPGPRGEARRRRARIGDTETLLPTAEEQRNLLFPNRYRANRAPAPQPTQTRAQYNRFFPPLPRANPAPVPQPAQGGTPKKSWAEITSGE